MITTEELAFLSTQPNITGYVSDERLSELGRIAKMGYEIDKKSRAKWEKQADEINKFVSQPSESKTYPWPEASNVRYPLILVTASQFNARAYPSIINSGNLALAKVIGNDETGEKQMRADRVSRHMSYQLTDEMDEWDADMDRLLFVIPLLGSAFKKVYFDPSKGRNICDYVHPIDLIVNNSCKSLKTCPRISHRIFLYPNEIQENINFEIFRDVEYGAHGEDIHEPVEFIEQHTWFDLDEDGYSEPYIITFAADSGEVARIAPNFVQDNIFINTKGDVVKITPEQYFVDYMCFPDPEGGFYGIGFGHMLLALNSSVDTILNQLIDSGHLANTGGGFIAKTFRVESGALRFTPGEYKKVDTAGFPMKDAIMPLPVPQPSQVLFSLLGLLIDAGKDVSSIQDVMTGGGGQNTPATTVLALIEQGMKVYTAIFKRIYRSLRQEMILLYRLNSRFLDPEKYVLIQDDPQAIAREDYNLEDIDIMPAADPEMATDIQKAAKVQVLMQFASFPGANVQQIMVDALKASGIGDAEKYILPDQGPSPEQITKLMEAQVEEGKLKLESVKTAAEVMKTIAEADEMEGNNLTNLREALYGAMEIMNDQRGNSVVEDGQQVVSGLPETGEV